MFYFHFSERIIFITPALAVEEKRPMEAQRRIRVKRGAETLFDFMDTLIAIVELVVSPKEENKG